MKAQYVEEISFWKYAGCGNDFILFDNRRNQFPVGDLSFIRQLCDRKQGVATDGLILLELSEVAHFKMRIFNSDGSEAEMCGNGIRCLVKFARQLGIAGDQYEVETLNGIYPIRWEGDLICVSMGPPTRAMWNISLEIEGQSLKLHFLNTGVPHAILFSKDIEKIDVHQLGSAIRHHPYFAPSGTNVNFVQIEEDHVLRVRTFERGVEAETLACGTGATASALAAAHLHEWTSPVAVKVRSGDNLNIFFEKSGALMHRVRMKGPAEFLYQGKVRKPQSTVFF